MEINVYCDEAIVNAEPTAAELDAAAVRAAREAAIAAVKEREAKRVAQILSAAGMDPRYPVAQVFPQSWAAQSEFAAKKSEALVQLQRLQDAVFSEPVREDGTDALSWMSDHFRDVCSNMDRTIQKILRTLYGDVDLEALVDTCACAENAFDLTEAAEYLMGALEPYRAGMKADPWWAD